jgi:hypothetical protein
VYVPSHILTLTTSYNLQRLIQLPLHINSIKVDADMRTLVISLGLVHTYGLQPVQLGIPTLLWLAKTGIGFLFSETSRPPL